MVILAYWFIGFFSAAILVLPFVAINAIKSFFRGSL